MALVFYRQRDIDAMDANHIPEEFVNYFETLTDERKAALLGTRRELAVALGFVLPAENETDKDATQESQLTDTVTAKQEDSPGTNALEKDSGIAEAAEDDHKSTDEFAQIRINRYENCDLNVIIKDNMPELEALAIPDDAESCLLHHVPFEEKTVRYISVTGAVYGLLLQVCPKCNRIYMRESRMERNHQALTERMIAHTFYPLDLSSRYLQSLLPVHEVSDEESLYVPDVWIEEKPVCPLHDTALYMVPCVKTYKDRRISFTGYRCDQCDKILVRNAAARDLEDECGRIGIKAIHFETIRK